MEHDEDLLPGHSAELHPLTHSGGALLMRSERRRIGRERRAAISRSSHGGWFPSATRRDPLAVLGDQNRRRFPDLVPLRWGRMAASPFTFYRGAAAMMAADLAATPVSGIVVQVCGDAHLQNFGLLATPERHLLFDLNDFDETLPGLWEWDVKRLAASVELAARDNGFSAADASTATLASVASYRTWMATFGEMSQLDLWYAKVDVDALLPLLPEDAQRRDALLDRALLGRSRGR